MLKYKLLFITLATLIVAGCANFSTQVFNAEKLAVDTAHSGVRIFNHLYDEATNNASSDDLLDWNRKRNQIYDASRKFATAAALVEKMRVQYATNATAEAKLDLQNSLRVLQANATEIVATITSITK